MEKVGVSFLLSVKQAAAYLGLSESRLRYEVFIKRIPHVKVGRTVRFTTEQLDSWVLANSQGGKCL